VAVPANSSRLPLGSKNLLQWHDVLALLLGLPVLLSESTESQSQNDVVLLLCQLVVVNQVDTIGVDVVLRVCAEQDGVVGLRADHPNRKFGLLEALADLEVSIVLVQSQEAHLSLVVDSFEHEVIA